MLMEFALREEYKMKGKFFVVMISILFLVPGVLAAQDCLLNSFFGEVTLNGIPIDGATVTFSDLNNGAPSLSTTTSSGGLYLIESANLDICAVVGDEIEINASFGDARTSTRVSYSSQIATNVNLILSSTPVDNVAPVITILGDNPVEIVQNSVYVDAGASALDNVDGDLSGSIITTNNINTAVLGTQTVSYSVSDSSGNVATATRIVNVVPEIVVDTFAPVITILGTNPINVEVGSVYVDAGASALDNVDGDLSGSIIVTNNVNSAVEGVYEVVYEVSDLSGNVATATRVVNVVNVIPDDNVAPVITILGDNPVEIVQNSVYVDVGASALDNVDGDLSGSIIVTNNVNSAVIGTQTVSYSVSDSVGNVATATRIVNVVPEIVVDTFAPVITILGDNPVEIVQNSVYVDAGASALDNVDGDLSGSIIVTNNVNSAVIGTQTVSYSVSDSSGNVATATRVVNVVLVQGGNNDSDGDGVEDDFDSIYGDKTKINSNFELEFELEDSSGNVLNNPSSYIGNGIAKFRGSDGKNRVEFEYNFSSFSFLNMSKIRIIEDENNSVGSIVVGGIDITGQGKTKTVFVNNKIATGRVCIKDAEVSSSNDISSSCNAVDEKIVTCNGGLQDGYSCVLVNNDTQYKISGLRHSAIRELENVQPVSTSSGGGSRGGGSSSSRLVSSSQQQLPVPSGNVNDSLNVSIDLDSEDESRTFDGDEVGTGGITGAVTGLFRDPSSFGILTVAILILATVLVVFSARKLG
jgi:hypothetical protein